MMVEAERRIHVSGAVPGGQRSTDLAYNDVVRHAEAESRGRTMREALEDGTLFTLRAGKPGDPHYVADYTPPGCRTVAEVIEGALHYWPSLRGAPVVVERHLPGSRIGCAMVERVYRGPCDVAAYEDDKRAREARAFCDVEIG